MPVYSILQSDYSEWSALSTYDKSVARYLIRAYRRIRNAGKTTAAYLDAYNLVHPYLTVARCPFQQQRIYYLRALKLSAENDYATALQWLDRVLAMTHELFTGDLAYVYYLRGGLNRAIMHLREAANDHRFALTLLNDPMNSMFAQDASFELSVLGQLGGFEFFLGQLESAERLLDQARTLVPLVSPHSLEVATVEWIYAHLYRLTRRPQLAVEASTRAAQIYTELGSSISASRILSVAAEAQLDLADSLPAGTARQDAVRAAGGYVWAAEDFATESREPNHLALAHLTTIRYERMSNVPSDRIGAIEAVWTLARRLDDDALLAQSVTALADELAATGRTEAALAHYRDVLGILDGSETPVLGYPALRAVLQADEQRRD